MIALTAKQPYRLMASLLYGTGMRLMECLRLWVKDVDFAYRQICGARRQGPKNRVTPLPEKLIEPLRAHLERVKALHETDRQQGNGAVFLPFALDRKYPNAAREWGWQYVFGGRLAVARVQELLGHSGVSTTMIYTHALNRGGKGVVSPLDRL